MICFVPTRAFKITKITPVSTFNPIYPRIYKIITVKIMTVITVMKLTIYSEHLK